MRWNRRLELFNQFVPHMLASGVRLTIVECAFGERPFDLPESPHYNLVRVRTNSVCWIKECLIDIGINHLPADAEYIAWSDGDIMFRHPQWASEAVHALQQYPIIQPWSNCIDLGPNGEVIKNHRSFVNVYRAEGDVRVGKHYSFGHPGYCWAARRSTLEYVGGLIEIGICGAGDHHMALALIGKVERSLPGGMTPGYTRPLYLWQARAIQHLHKSLGCLAQPIEHFWHGRPEKRQYQERWDILRRNHFDPDTDIKRNTYGIIELAGNKPQLTHDMDVYFRQRNEDGNELD
jgi:hypothetical protein